MSEPNVVIFSSGAGLVTVATIVLGPLLGEYSIIVGLGMLGTLAALSEISHPSIKDSILFLLKGVTFSFVFTGLITLIALKLIPEDWGLTPYTMLGVVSFIIGWSTDRLGYFKDKLISKIGQIISSSESKK